MSEWSSSFCLVSLMKASYTAYHRRTVVLKLELCTFSYTSCSSYLELKWEPSEKQGTRTRYCPKPITNTELKKEANLRFESISYSNRREICKRAGGTILISFHCPQIKRSLLRDMTEWEAKIISIALCILEMLRFLLVWILTACWMTSTCRLLISVPHNPFHEDNIAPIFFFFFFALHIKSNFNWHRIFSVILSDSLDSVTQSCLYNLTRGKSSMVGQWHLASERPAEQRMLKHKEEEPSNSEIARRGS